MSAERKPRKSPGRRPPRAISMATVRSPVRPSGRPAPPTRVPHRHVSGQYLGPVRSVGGRPRAGAAAVAQPATQPGHETPSPSSTSRAPRRLSASTAALVAVVGLEMAALAILGAHLVSGPHEVAPVSAGGSTYAAPVALPAGTAYIRSRVVAPDSLAVTHWIHADRSVSSLRIRVPRTPGLVPGRVAVADLVIASGGRSIPGSVLPAAAHARTYVLPPGRHIYVSYVLTGTIRSSGTPAGRALAQITALDVAAPQGPVARTTYRVVGARILALACSPNRSDGIALPCGEPAAGGWQVDLRDARSDDRVMAQMDLS